MREITKKQFVSSAVWKMLSDYLAKGISLVVSIILARLLQPSDYGLIALTTVFLVYSGMLIDGGFGTALIRKEKVDDLDYSSVFVINFLVAAVLYGIFYLIAPAVATYYKELQFKSVLRVMSLTLFVQALSSTRNAYITRNMDFKFLFICNSSASVSSGIVGIVAAYLGAGVWALVIQQLLQNILITLLLFFRVRLKISMRIDFSRIVDMFKFGIGVVGSSIINYLPSSISSAVIGKRFSVIDLGYCDKGGQFPMQLSLYTFGALSSVLLPTLSSYQKDIYTLKHVVRRVVRMTAFIIIPLMAGLALTAREVTIILLTEKWLPIVKIMQYSCIYYCAMPFMLINVQVFFALGHSFIRMKTELIRLAMVLLSLVMCILLNWTIYTLTLAGAVISILSAALTAYECYKLIGYSFSEIISDLCKSIIAGLFMCLVVIAVCYVVSIFSPVGIVMSAVIKVFIGILSYFLISSVLKIDEYVELKEMTLSFLRGRKDG